MRRLLLAAVLLLGACGSQLPPPPKTFRQDLVEAGVTYSTVAGLATAYAEQQRCGTPNAKPAPFCADAATVVTLGRANKAALATMQIAQALDGVNNPDAQAAALAAVQAALSDFSAMTSAAKGK